MTWWTTATLTDGLVFEVVAVVCFVAACAALVVAVGLFIHVCTTPHWASDPTWLFAIRLACTVGIAMTCSSLGQIAWPPGHPVGVAFVAAVVVVAAVPVAVGCAAIVALCIRVAAADRMAMHGTAADQLDEFIESAGAADRGHLS